MRKNYILITILFLSSLVYSQNSAYEKFSGASNLPFPYTDKIDMQINHDKFEITEADWILYKFNNLETYDSDFQYYVYGAITINGNKLLLIERNYREEKNHWAVYISDDRKIFSHLNIAYDNSEGFLYIESDISENMIKVKENNDFDEKGYSETVYIVTKTGFEKK